MPFGLDILKKFPITLPRSAFLMWDRAVSQKIPSKEFWAKLMFLMSITSSGDSIPIFLAISSMGRDRSKPMVAMPCLEVNSRSLPEPQPAKRTG